MFRIVFWDVLMKEAVHTSETSVDNYFTRQYIPEDNSEHHTRRRENLKSHISNCMFAFLNIGVQRKTECHLSARYFSLH
jgi:hypothetical protein